MDFARLVETFETHQVTFVSVTQQFNTTTSMGRLTLKFLLSFAQFEREVIGERIRDKVAASRRKGLWMGGMVPLGYRVETRKLVVVDKEAELVRRIFSRFAALGSALKVARELNVAGETTKRRPQAHPGPRRRRADATVPSAARHGAGQGAGPGLAVAEAAGPRCL
jgi:DNA invertase Pin-like site-specific DNA recombinase